ncbi:MAG: hypothetical protein GY743_14275 [Planctomycetaceae bacterium]|nr:hypothetical protein [Planctomycetaceae bacterium]
MSRLNLQEMDGLDAATMCASLEDSFRHFSTNLNGQDEGALNFHLNSALLVTAVNLLIDDINRHKTLHDRSVSKVRIASYVAYWIQKIKPIQIDKNSSEFVSTDFFVNEMFAVFIFFSILEINEKSILETFYFELIYHFRFRAVDAEGIYMIGTALVASRRSD